MCLDGHWKLGLMQENFTKNHINSQPPSTEPGASGKKVGLLGQSVFLPATFDIVTIVNAAAAAIAAAPAAPADKQTDTQTTSSLRLCRTDDYAA